MASVTPAALMAMLLLSTWPLTADGHGWVLDPPARNYQAGPRNGYCPHCGNGNGICGDGNQWPRGSDYLNFYNGPVKVWSAGGIEKVEVRITAHHKGHFEMSVCDQVLNSSVEDPQACLDKWVLERASPEEAGFTDCAKNDKRGGCQPVDPLHKERFYLPPSSFNLDTYTFYVKVPPGLKCKTCTLQWRWWSANSCVQAKDYGCYATVLAKNGYDPADWGVSGWGAQTCPGGGCDRCGCGEEFRNCIDIAIVKPADGVSSSSSSSTTQNIGSSTTAITTTGASTTGASAGTTTAPLSSSSPSRNSSLPECVPHSVLTCINDKSSYWPKCDEGQSKTVVGPAGYEFGFYCSEVWSRSLNEMLSDPAVDKCYDKEAIHKVLAQVAYETGYFSTVYQPRDGGAGMIHMIPGNWPENAKDMDTLFPGSHYESILNGMGSGKDFFQAAEYGWKSVAAWFKQTNRVIGGCGKDLFEESFEEQTRCILSRVVSRQEAYDIVGSCLSESAAATTSASTSAPTTTASAATTATTVTTVTTVTAATTATTATSATTVTTATTSTETTADMTMTSSTAASGSCVRNPNCAENPWCNDPAYDTWCPQQIKFGGPCPTPHCTRVEGDDRTSTTATTTTTVVTTSAEAPSCSRNPNCEENPWCKDPAYDTWCPLQIKFGGPCPTPHCTESNGRRLVGLRR